MKNIHRINGLIYITSDVEVLDGEYGACLHLIRVGLSANSAIFKMDKRQRRAMEKLGGRKKAEVVKLILTNDPALITDGIQAIEPDAVKWLNENPSCEWVDVSNFPKHEPKYPIGGFAPGNYSCKCIDCKKSFIGDKLAIQCESCAKISTTRHQTIEEAAEKANPIIIRSTPFGTKYEWTPKKERTNFILGAKSRAARDYWYNIFKSEQQC